MPKPKRLYQQKNTASLIVCHRGAHYVSGELTQFTYDCKVTVTGDKGASSVTVTRAGDHAVTLTETWSLKGSYSESAPASPSTPPEAPAVIESVPQETGEPTSELDRQLQEAQRRLAVRKAG